MAGESTSLGGTMRAEARGAVGPTCREGRVSSLENGRLLVSIRSLMGDTKPVPVQGWQPIAQPGGADPLEPSRGDAVWVTQDEAGGLVVVTWEPRG
jgi:hypothetical protein